MTTLGGLHHEYRKAMTQSGAREFSRIREGASTAGTVLIYTHTLPCVYPFPVRYFHSLSCARGSAASK